MNDIEDWRQADALGSFEVAMQAMRDRYKAGEHIPMTAYFKRSQIPGTDAKSVLDGDADK